jgi:hypothetical protein
MFVVWALLKRRCGFSARMLRMFRVGMVGVGQAAHHAQHGDPAGADKPNDEPGGEDEEGDVEPGGVVPGDASQ